MEIAKPVFLDAYTVLSVEMSLSSSYGFTDGGFYGRQLGLLNRLYYLVDICQLKIGSLPLTPRKPCGRVKR